MELNIGDLVSHKVHKDINGYGIIISPSKNLFYKTLVCTVQWIQTGYTHIMDVDMLEKVTTGQKMSYPPTPQQDTLEEEDK